MKGISKKRVFVTGATQGIGRAIMTDYANLFRLDGKVALVTGAARGIGAAVAEAMAASGASVLLTDVVDDAVINNAVNSLNDRFPGLAAGKRVDVTDEKQVIAAFEHLREICPCSRCALDFRS